MKFISVTKREIIIAILALILGLGIGLDINKSKISESKKITGRILNNCTESLLAANSLINSCSFAYKEFGVCVVNLEACDLEESSKKLEKLNQQKIEAKKKIKSLTKDMDSIIESIK